MIRPATATVATHMPHVRRPRERRHATAPRRGSRHEIRVAATRRAMLAAAISIRIEGAMSPRASAEG
jgi:hypothetical protein